MRKVLVQNIGKVRRAVPRIENAVKVKIGVRNKGEGARDFVTVSGSELNEFLVEEIIRAIDFGFDVDDALLLLRNEFVLEFIEVKEHTRRKNLRDVRSRIIGRSGKARKTIEKLTGACIVINGNDVGVIVDSAHLSATVQGLESLIGGSKHGNVFGFLERQGVKLNEDFGDLGLREGVDFDRGEGDMDEGRV